MPASSVASVSSIHASGSGPGAAFAGRVSSRATGRETIAISASPTPGVRQSLAMMCQL